MIKRIIKRIFDLFLKIFPDKIANEINVKRLKTLPRYWQEENLVSGLEKLYKAKTDEELDINNPITFSEKLQWLKLYWNNEDLARVVDKCEFKRYIAEKIGEGYTVPMYGEWENVKDINWKKLPKSFVLKSNCCSDGKYIKIIKNKDEIDFKELKKELKEWLNPYKTLINSYCKAYWDVKPKILAEKYVEQIDGQVYDYKFFCFDGDPKFAYVATDHFDDGKNIENHRISIYDLDWNLMDVKYGEHPQNNVPAPKNLAKMIELAKEASKEFPFVRVDFFEIEDKVYFSELTFYPGGGLHKIHPEHINKEWGSYMSLPEKKDIHKSHRYILK